jgi:transcriptional regulator with XRE-family HTH domain
MYLRQIRQSRNLSVPKLVEISGVPRRTIQEIEKRNDCHVSTAKKLAAALNVTLDELCKEGL